MKNGHEAVWDYYRQHPELHMTHPLALMPEGQKCFANYMFSLAGSERRGIGDEQIRSFLQGIVANVERGIIETYLLTPNWQRRFPRALMRGREQKAFVSWLKTRYSVAVRRLPSVLRLTERRALRDLLRQGRKHRSKRIGLNIMGHFCYPSGLQRAALTTGAALRSVGVRTSCRDVPSGVATTLENRARWLGLEIYPTTLISVAPVPFFETVYLQAGLAKRDGVYRIGSWYWELDRMPPEWKRLAKMVSETWAPSSFIASAMKASLDVPVYEMRPAVFLGPVEKFSRAEAGIPEGNFVFLFIFDMCSEIARKNPFGLIRAFRLAFSPDEPATLLIKVTRGDANLAGLADLEEAAKAAKVQLVDKLVTRPQALGYIQMCDCFVSLHRSEGFGLPMAEAMLLGKPVIATNYSGNLDFMTAENSFLINYKLVEIQESGPIYRAGNRWAEPSTEHAASLMREVFEKREEAIKKAAVGQREARKSLSMEAAGRRMLKRLREIHS